MVKILQATTQKTQYIITSRHGIDGRRRNGYHNRHFRQPRLQPVHHCPRFPHPFATPNYAGTIALESGVPFVKRPRHFGAADVRRPFRTTSHVLIEKCHRAILVPPDVLDPSMACSPDRLESDRPTLQVRLDTRKRLLEIRELSYFRQGLFTLSGNELSEGTGFGCAKYRQPGQLLRAPIHNEGGDASRSPRSLHRCRNLLGNHLGRHKNPRLEARLAFHRLVDLATNAPLVKMSRIPVPTSLVDQPSPTGTSRSAIPPSLTPRPRPSHMDSQDVAEQISDEFLKCI